MIRVASHYVSGCASFGIESKRGRESLFGNMLTSLIEPTHGICVHFRCQCTRSCFPDFPVFIPNFGIELSANWAKFGGGYRWAGLRSFWVCKCIVGLFSAGRSIFSKPRVIELLFSRHLASEELHIPAVRRTWRTVSTDEFRWSIQDGLHDFERIL